jgi:hypothetical protein
MVVCSMAVNMGSSATASIFVLPAGYRPPGHIYFVGIQASFVAPAYIMVYGSGLVVPGAGNVGHTSCEFTFLAEQ